MRHILIMLGLLGGAMKAFAGHPNLRIVDIDGQKYIAHRAESISYCPALDVVLNIRIGIDRDACLEKVLSEAEVTSAALASCYLPPKYRFLLDQIQLMDVNKKCVTEYRNRCADIDIKTNRPNFDFVDRVREAGYGHLFGQAQVDQSCDSLIYP